MIAVIHQLPQAGPSADQLLAEARRAWVEKKAAELTLSRLRRYTGMNAGMRYDASKAKDRLYAAEQTLQRVLGGAA